MKEIISKTYCMSHYLAFRFIKDENINFFPNKKKHSVYKPVHKDLYYKCKTVEDIEYAIKNNINKFFLRNKTGLFLSGGIDSAILASFLPKGTPVFTFKCIAEGAIDETIQAKKYAEKYMLNSIVVPIYWHDFEKYTREICQYQNIPVHSIEIQLYKASLIAKDMGIERIIIGESADLHFGGMDKLLSQDWEYDEFIKRYTFVEPQLALKEFIDITPVYQQYKNQNGKINLLKFLDEVFAIESTTSYMHAFEMAGLKYLDPYSYMRMAIPLDLERIRSGEPKYLLRELFKKRYPGIDVPHKIPMPRAMDQWLANWEGPIREEFIPNCTQGMSGDQKWLVWCLEQFLNTEEA